MDELRPKVGTGIIILKDNKFLLGKRTNKKHGAGEYALVGGHLEHGESIIECAKRETREEAGIEIKNVRFLALSNEKKYLPKHYVNIGLVADWESGEPQNLEPEKLESWNWYDLDHLPSPLYDGAAKFLEAFKSGQNFFDC